MLRFTIVPALILSVLFGASLPAITSAQLSHTWTGHLTGNQVVPPTGSAGSASLYVMFYSGGVCSEWSGDSLEVSIYRPVNLQGTPIAVRLHQGAEGLNGPLIAERSADQTLRFAWRESDCAALLDTTIHVVLTTSAFPDGEIRSQLIYQPPLPVVETSWGRIRARYRRS